jgi:hypothetical protein
VVMTADNNIQSFRSKLFLELRLHIPSALYDVMNTALYWPCIVVSVVPIRLPGSPALTIKAERDRFQRPSRGQRLKIMFMKVAPFGSFGWVGEGLRCHADLDVS